MFAMMPSAKQIRHIVTDKKKAERIIRRLRKLHLLQSLQYEKESKALQERANKYL